MLVLARKVGQTIPIADEVEVTLLEICGSSIKLGVAAPRDISVWRKELYLRIQEEKKNQTPTQLAEGGEDVQPGQS